MLAGSAPLNAAGLLAWWLLGLGAAVRLVWSDAGTTRTGSDRAADADARSD